MLYFGALYNPIITFHRRWIIILPKYTRPKSYVYDSGKKFYFYHVTSNCQTLSPWLPVLIRWWWKPRYDHIPDASSSCGERSKPAALAPFVSRFTTACHPLIGAICFIVLQPIWKHWTKFHFRTLWSSQWFASPSQWCAAVLLTHRIDRYDLSRVRTFHRSLCLRKLIFFIEKLFFVLRSKRHTQLVTGPKIHVFCRILQNLGRQKIVTIQKPLRALPF